MRRAAAGPASPPRNGTTTIRSRLGSCALIVAIFYHGQLGLQVVVEDYVHTEWLKLAGIVVMKLASLLLATACLFAVLSIAFRS